jgi:hypothetical protein
VSHDAKKQTLVALPGNFLSVVGLGLSLTGWTSVAMGLAVMAVGVAWAGTAYGWPLIRRRLASSVAPLVLQELRPSVSSESGEDQATRHRRALRLVLTELRSLEATARQARKDGHYPYQFQLPAIHWGEWHAELTAHANLDEAVDAANRAYEKANYVNQRVQPRLYEDLLVYPIDDLDGLIQISREAQRHVQAAIEALDSSISGS